MRFEIKCAHPERKKGYYGPNNGWICETEKGGCGATGGPGGEHYSPIQGYVEIDLDALVDALAARNKK